MVALGIRGGNGFSADLCAEDRGSPPPPGEQREQLRGCGGSAGAAGLSRARPGAAAACGGAAAGERLVPAHPGGRLLPCLRHGRDRQEITRGK